MLRVSTCLIAAAAFLTCAHSAAATEGDASRGAQALRELGCLNCHGANRADVRVLDLQKRHSRGFTASDLACILWNHGALQPAVFATSIDETQMADLFAYFASRRFFESPGNARNGKVIFYSKHCADCHGLTESNPGGGSAVDTWSCLNDTIQFAQEIWNHAPQTAAAFAQKGLRHPSLTADEMNDLLLYLQNNPATRIREERFHFDTGGDGRQLFESKGCAACHMGNLSLEKRAARSSLADVAAAMWNHAPVGVENHTNIAYGEMSRLVGYVWSIEVRGRERKGEALFVLKNCIQCHSSGVVTDIANGQRELPPFVVVAGMGAHGSAAISEMNAKGLPWPRLTRSEMADISEYLAIVGWGGTPGK